MKTTEARLQELEASLRRYRVILIVVGAGVVASVFAAAAPTLTTMDVIHAKRIEIIGPDGHATIVLNTSGPAEHGYGHGYIDVLSDTGPAPDVDVAIRYDDDRHCGAITVQKRGAGTATFP
jgi:hypothetical protein